MELMVLLIGVSISYVVEYVSGSNLSQKILHSESHSQSTNSSLDYDFTVGLRPIVTLKAGVLENSGNGSSSNPWVLTDSY